MDGWFVDGCIDGWMMAGEWMDCMMQEIPPEKETSGARGGCGARQRSRALGNGKPTLKYTM